ncbi:uncharacterized protein LOC107824955 [Nicotiana tabacum]|uniref:Uncharacterized protein LOC107824955 n=1 Tax=Nicotiana tabacum TaxID=4097 RepID=A0A1S4D1W9_TOBAC
MSGWKSLSIKKLYNTMRGEFQKVTWRILTCNNVGAPKRIFVLNLAIQKRLLTRDRLNNWGITDVLSCPMYNEENETMDHLFFSCVVSKEVWGKVLKWQGISRTALDWQKDIEWAERNAKDRNVDAQLYRVTLACVVYHIWRERNMRVFQGQQQQNEVLVRHIIQEVTSRGLMKNRPVKKLETLNFYP